MDNAIIKLLLSSGYISTGWYLHNSWWDWTSFLPVQLTTWFVYIYIICAKYCIFILVCAKQHAPLLHTGKGFRLDRGWHPRVICVDSSPPSAANTPQWIGSASVQIMACRLFGTKPLSKQSLVIVNWTVRNKLQWNLNRNSIIFIQENAFENGVCQNDGHFFQGEMGSLPYFL